LLVGLNLGMGDWPPESKYRAVDLSSGLLCPTGVHPDECEEYKKKKKQKHALH
jgi:hypothetical protein